MSPGLLLVHRCLYSVIKLLDPLLWMKKKYSSYRPLLTQIIFKLFPAIHVSNNMEYRQEMNKKASGLKLLNHLFPKQSIVAIILGRLDLPYVLNRNLKDLRLSLTQHGIKEQSVYMAVPVCRHVAESVTFFSLTQ